MTKKQFIVNHLAPMLKALNEEVKYCYYFTKGNGSELIEIAYQDGCSLMIDITDMNKHEITINSLLYGRF